MLQARDEARLKDRGRVVTNVNNLVLGTEGVRVRPERPIDVMQRKVEKYACIGGVNVMDFLEYWICRRSYHVAYVSEGVEGVY